MGDKSVETLGVKFDFQAPWTYFPPSLKKRFIFLFLSPDHSADTTLNFGGGGGTGGVNYNKLLQNVTSKPNSVMSA